MNGIKKSAKFLSSLDWSTISQLLDCMDADTAKALRREIISVGKISLAESDQLANEFLQAAGHKPKQIRNKFATETFEISSGAYNTPSQGRINNLTRLTNIDSTPAYSPTLNNSGLRFAGNQNYHKDTAAIKKQPFEFLFDQTPRKIADAICREHPQTIAVILAALPDLLAGETLSTFPPALQQDVGRRLAEIKLSGIDFVSDPVLLEIESELRRRFSKLREVTFEDLERLDDLALIDLFRSVDMRTAMYALAGANPNFIARITQKFTPTEEFIMRKLLREAGTIDENEVENARAILIDKAPEFLNKGNF
ncbi:MAG: hypothetical protein LBP59_09650 [Planctomycetaceae bacterium]|nr:hypothetical protein [Planctomycetaceae bacterium]